MNKFFDVIKWVILLGLKLLLGADITRLQVDIGGFQWSFVRWRGLNDIDLEGNLFGDARC
jgi:hypothetical protein